MVERFACDRICVLRALQLGDLICAGPAFVALRRGFPRARITLCRTKDLCPSPAFQAIVVVMLPRDGREHHGKKSRRLRIIVCHT